MNVGTVSKSLDEMDTDELRVAFSELRAQMAEVVRQKDALAATLAEIRSRFDALLA